MDVRLSSEQRALREAAAQMVDRLGPQSVADLDDGERSAKLEAALAASGWRELRSGNDDGTPWASAVEAALVAEELGRGLADVAFLGPILAADLRRMGGGPPASAGETIALRSDLVTLACVTAADEAVDALAIDAAGSERATYLIAVPAGYQLGSALMGQRHENEVDLTRRTAPVSLPEGDAATAPWSETTLSWADLSRWTALGLAVAAADLVGTMRGTLRHALAHAQVRKQYGVPVGSFQAVQHMLADAHVALEGSRSVALYAAWAVDGLAPDDALAAGSMAKAYCARAARSVCETSIQVHGGMGNTWECLAHLYLRRALVSSDVLGNVGHSLERVMDHRTGQLDGFR